MPHELLVRAQPGQRDVDAGDNDLTLVVDVQPRATSSANMESVESRGGEPDPTHSTAASQSSLRYQRLRSGDALQLLFLGTVQCPLKEFKLTSELPRERLEFHGS